MIKSQWIEQIKVDGRSQNSWNKNIENIINLSKTLTWIHRILWTPTKFFEMISFKSSWRRKIGNLTYKGGWKKVFFVV